MSIYIEFANYLALIYFIKSIVVSQDSQHNILISFRNTVFDVV